MNPKSLRFLGTSLEDLRKFPEQARRFAGFNLRAVQNGMEPADWKPMRQIGTGVKEIRLHFQGEWRVIYVAHFREAVYVLHAFGKKTQKTSQRDIDLGRKRYKELEELHGR